MQKYSDNVQSIILIKQAAYKFCRAYFASLLT